MNTKAIVVYVDDTERCLEEFTWLYKSWRLWKLDDEFDIVAYCNPTAVDKISRHKNIIVKSKESLKLTDPFWKEYGFVNSFAMFNDQKEIDWTKEKYTHIMKTDCDVFLTRHLAGHAPKRLMIGQGGYINPPIESAIEVKTNLERVAKSLKLRRNDLSNIGASLFGMTDYICPVVRNQFEITKYLLKTEWKTDQGNWPGWYKGVASMYAIDLAINDAFNNQHVNLYVLDEKCWPKTTIDKSTLHIHAWHSGQYFSKHEWFKGKYDKLTVNSVPIDTAEYCHWIVSNDLETLMKVAENEKDT